jgi:malic enzyme
VQGWEDVSLAETNNSYIFPVFGMAVLAKQASRVADCEVHRSSLDLAFELTRINASLDTQAGRERTFAEREEMI